MREKGSKDLKGFMKKPKTIVTSVIIVLLLIIIFRTLRLYPFESFSGRSVCPRSS